MGIPHLLCSVSVSCACSTPHGLLVGIVQNLSELLNTVPIYMLFPPPPPPPLLC